MSHLLLRSLGRVWINGRIRNRCLLLTLICVAWAPVSVRGQDYFGVLAELQRPSIADELKLSEEQREQVQDLLRKRRMEVMDLVDKLKEAPVDQGMELRRQFGANSEQLAFDLLNDEQKDRFAKYRVEWKGMLGLTDPEIGKALNLADWQYGVVAEWYERSLRYRRGPESERVRGEAERAIRESLSDSQYAMWQLLAGQIAETTVVDPMPPERGTPEMNDDQDTQIAQSSREASPSDVAVSGPIDDLELDMTFNGTPWSDVIKWLSDQADLSLQPSSIPQGTFTYRGGSDRYSVQQAMDIINSSMLDTGHQLVRSGKVLRCYDFEAIPEDLERGVFLREIAPVVSAAELSRRGDFEPVTHTFHLKRLDPENVKADVEQLLGIQGRVDAFPTTGDLVVTDIAKKVRAIGEMIARAEESGGSTVQVIDLEHIAAEEILMAARPLLGLEEAAMSNDDISISTTTFGTKIFARGQAEKVQILRDLVEQMDVNNEQGLAGVGELETPEIRRHPVGQIDLQLAYDISSQMLAGAPGVRLAKDENTKQLILQARPSEHDMISKMLGNVVTDSKFEIIQLNNLDTLMGIEAVKKFFSLTDDADGEGGGPVLDGDVLARQVWVKGSEAEVAQIRSFLQELDSRAKAQYPDTIAQIPLTGRAAERALEQAKQLWQLQGGKGRIRQLQSGGGSSGLQEKTFAPNRTDGESRALKGGKPAKPMAYARPGATGDSGVFVASYPQEQVSAPADALESEPVREDDILIMQGPAGLIVSSQDKEVLAQFTEMLKLMSVQMGATEPTIVYLKNIKAEAAKELLETIMSGTVDSGGGGSLLGDVAGGMMGGMFGAMLGGGAGDLIGTSAEGLASGDYTITADPRLNALVIKAGPSDMMLMEQLIEVIDQVESPVEIETQGQRAMIPVITKDAAEVVTIIKELYGDRIQGASSSGGGGGGGGRGGQPDPAAFIQALRGGGGRGGRGGGGGQTQLAEPKISITAEPSTNMLIVQAQPQQIDEIRQLVEMIDQAGAADPEEIAVTDLGGIKGDLVADGVKRMLGSQVQTNVAAADASSGSGSSNSTSGRDNNDNDDAAAQARRAAFFERLRAGGGGFGGRGGGPGGGGFGGFGGRGGGAPGGGTTGGRGGRGGRGG